MRKISLELLEELSEDLRKKIECIESRGERYYTLNIDKHRGRISTRKFNKVKRELFEKSYKELWSFYYNLLYYPDVHAYIFDMAVRQTVDLLWLGMQAKNYDILPYIRNQLKIYKQRVENLKKEKPIEIVEEE